jgi:membrane protein DedA with SNARE-associated domain
MEQWITSQLEYCFAHWGYWTVLVGIMLESAGIPVPGETILIIASTLAASSHQLNIFMVAAIAVAAATGGDNLGFAVGRHAGRPLLVRYRHVLHIGPAVIQKGEQLMLRRGAVTVFFARFIAGLRFLAGPLAGVLRMSWRRFLVFNALGAIAWVATICSLAYLFGPALESALQNSGWVLAVAVVACAAFYFWRSRRKHRQIPGKKRAA